MFLALLLALLAGAFVHTARVGSQRTRRDVGRILLLWLLVGYCGVPMLLVGLAILVWPAHVAAHLGFPAGNPFQAFLGAAYLGMALLSVLALRYRGSFLIGPAVCWIVFFGGATAIHLGEYHRQGGLTHGGALAVFATHGLIAALLLGALVMSGLLRERG